LDSLGRHEEADDCYASTPCPTGPHPERAWCECNTDPDILPQKTWYEMGGRLQNISLGVAMVDGGGKALAQYLNGARSWYDLGVALHFRGRFEAEVYCLDRALDIIPGYAAPWARIGVTYASLGVLEAAISAVGRSLEMNPGCAEYRMADYVVRDACQRDIWSAFDYLNSYEESDELEDPDEPEKPETGPEEAESIYNRLDSDHAPRGYGERLRDVACSKEDTGLLGAALEFVPQNAVAWTAKGSVLAMFEHHEEAVRCYDM